VTARTYRAHRYRSARPVPRRRTASGRTYSRVRWDRVGRVTLVIVLFAVLASYFNPLVNFVDAWRDSKTERARLVDLKRENTELEQRSADLAHSTVLENEARRTGMIREGEIPYVVRGLP
jgi:cell division protein FtsB